MLKVLNVTMFFGLLQNLLKTVSFVRLVLRRMLKENLEEVEFILGRIS